MLGPEPLVVSLIHGRFTTFTLFAGTVSVATIIAPRVTVTFAAWSVVFDTETAKVSFGTVL